MDLILYGCLIGVIATAKMDVWIWIAHRFFGFAPANWAPIGRWFAACFRGKMLHHDIGAVAPIPNETAIGWAFHYAIGAIYGVIFLALAGMDWLTHPTLWPALLFGWITISAGWFFLQPCLGLGIALSKTPTPTKGRIAGLLAHTAFGTGLWDFAAIMALLS